MDATLGRDGLGSRRSMSKSKRRPSFRSVSSRSWASASVREIMFPAPGGDVFQKSTRENDDEQELKWAAIERLPTYDRLRKGILKQTLDVGKTNYHEVDVVHLGLQDRKQILENILKVVEEDDEKLFRRLRDRIDRVGIDIPKVDVRFEHLCIDGDAYVGSIALPTLWNASINFVEGFLENIKIVPSKKKVVNILSDVNGIVRPSRMTLLLGPPGSGKTTLLKALAGVLDKDLRVSDFRTSNMWPESFNLSRVTKCVILGERKNQLLCHELSDFIPQRTCAYISQHDIHHGELTVRETLDFAGRCLGVGTRYELLTELSRHEKDAGIKSHPEIDSFMKAIAIEVQESSLVTDYVLKILGMDICADIMVGDEMRRGISGGQKKLLTIGEMLVGLAKVFFMDEISTGLDSSTTFQIVKFMRQMVHIMDVTMIISLLQPAPETYHLFDDIILLSEGKVVYQGPRENVLEFFESVGFKCPERKGVADFLQEVTSLKDQEQYWFRKNEPYQYISVAEFAERFSNFHVGQQLFNDLGVPYDKSKAHPAALVTEKYGISNMELLKACLSREWLLIKRHSFLYIFKTFQITVLSIITFTVFFRTEMKPGQIADGGKFYGALFFSLIKMMFNGTAELGLTVSRLPVFFKQRDSLFYPAWAFALPIWLLKIPLSFVESLIWITLTYYTIRFAPDASRTQVVANTFATFTMLIVFVLGGFIVAKGARRPSWLSMRSPKLGVSDDLRPWMRWGYYISPMTYGQNAVAINEFLDDRWNTPHNDTRFSEPTVGKVLLKERSMYTEDHVFWLSLGDSRSVISDDGKSKKKKRTQWSSASSAPMTEGIVMDARNTNNSSIEEAKRRGMVLPFQPLSLAFNHINYYVDMPAEMKAQGVDETRLQLLRDVSGAFRPGVLTALVGVSGAGKKEGKQKATLK
ncbi:ABC transporter G family member 39 [Capsicum annuum]|nr:ABC transporter G family member 39 [Capsicum annuum]